MIVRVHTSNNTPKSSNKGSSGQLFSYLNKEDEKKPYLEKTGFFNQNEENISSHIATKTIDENKGRLAQNEAKFYMLTINPSKKELSHLMPKGKLNVEDLTQKELKGYEDKLKDYTREVMKNYAVSFDRNIKHDDLVYYSKIEHERHYKGDEAKKLNVKTHTKKEGLNSHIHVVVSRFNKEQTKKISPLSKKRAVNENTVINNKKVKQGFNHLDFRIANEKSFDTKFHYQRTDKERINNRIERKQQSFSSANLNQAKNIALNSAVSPISEITKTYDSTDVRTIFRSELSKMNPISSAIKEQVNQLKSGLMYGKS